MPGWPCCSAPSSSCTSPPPSTSSFSCPACLAGPVVLLPHPPILLLLRQLLHLYPAPLYLWWLLCLLHLLSLHLLNQEACGGLLHLVREGKVGNLGVVHDPFEQVVRLA